MDSRERAVIIGAGIGGLASAIRLRVKGYHVEVLEAAARPGGKLSVHSVGGYRFDTGPSLFTMPQYVDELFVLAGKNPREYFSYNKLHEVCRYFFADGVRLTAAAGEDDFAAEVEKVLGTPARLVTVKLNQSRQIYRITHKVFLERSLHKVKSYLHLDTLWSLLRFGQIDAFRTLAASNRQVFTDERMQQLFNRYATYNGSNPYQAPATLNVIPHFEFGFGAYMPAAGMYSIVEALYRLAVDIGIKFHFNSAAKLILTSGRRVSGVASAANKVFAAQRVVSNADVYYTYKHLLPSLPMPRRVATNQRSSSALIFYWGITKTFSELGLHNIFFSADYRKEFDDIWQHDTIPAEPTVYVNITSKHVRGDAPTGCENWFVMINVPSDSGQDWTELTKKARKGILTVLNKALGVHIEPLINYEHVLTPPGIQTQTSSWGGALYGSSSNSRYAAFLRHPNFSRAVRGLYFAGGSVHPGGGIPLALLSARIASGI